MSVFVIVCCIVPNNCKALTSNGLYGYILYVSDVHTHAHTDTHWTGKRKVLNYCSF